MEHLGIRKGENWKVGVPNFLRQGTYQRKVIERIGD